MKQNKENMSNSNAMKRFKMYETYEFFMVKASSICFPFTISVAASSKHTY